jgi:hypothetical protein
MWTSIVRTAIALPTTIFAMWVLAQVVGPIVDFALAGPNADAASVQRVGSYFTALTVDNLVLIGAVAVGLFALTRAAVERRVR